MAVYNLTTRSGYAEAGKWLKNYGWTISLLPWLIYKLFSPEVSSEKQVKMVIALIKAGKEQNVKKMNVRVNHQAGLDIGTNIEGIPIHTKIGNDGKIELEVEYK